MTFENTKYEHEVGKMDYINFRRTLKKKNIDVWMNENVERITTAVLVMQELGIGKRTFEFHDADIISGKRLKTYSDEFDQSKYEPVIVSPNVESSYIDNMHMIKDKKGYFGGLFEYVTKKDMDSIKDRESINYNKLSYSCIDSLIFDYVSPRLDRYLRAALALGKDCYFPIAGYKNSASVKHDNEVIDNILKSISNIKDLEITQVENNVNNNGYVKVIKVKIGSN